MSKRTTDPGYALDTRVPVTKTKQEIEALIVQKNKADNYAVFSNASGAQIAFEMQGRRMLFRLPLPKPGSEQDVRSRWRGLLLCIRAKFEAIHRGVETFDEAFLAHMMTPTGETVADVAVPRLTALYKGESVPLLPPPKEKAT